jgi:hypothetical protein
MRKIKTVRRKRGERMKHGKGWRLHRNDKEFVGCLLYTVNFSNGKRLALFSVPRR